MGWTIFVFFFFGEGRGERGWEGGRGREGGGLGLSGSTRFEGAACWGHHLGVFFSETRPLAPGSI